MSDCSELRLSEHEVNVLKQVNFMFARLDAAIGEPFEKWWASLRRDAPEGERADA